MQRQPEAAFQRDKELGDAHHMLKENMYRPRVRVSIVDILQVVTSTIQRLDTRPFISMVVSLVTPSGDGHLCVFSHMIIFIYLSVDICTSREPLSHWVLILS